MIGDCDCGGGEDVNSAVVIREGTEFRGVL